jgi:predicted TIM-barrel fold metal-dependent hydrolase
MTDSPAYNLISADSHVLEPPDLFEKHLPASLRSRAPKLESWNGGSAWMLEGLDPVPLPATAATGSGYRLDALTDRKPVSVDEVLPGLFDPAERILLQDTDSVDAEVLYPSPALWDAINQFADRDLKLACVRAYNDWIAAFCSHNPDRLIGLAKIPSTTCEDARQELLRCVKELNMRGVILDAWPSGSSRAGDSRDEPFWEAINDAAVPVSLHYALGADVQTAPPGGIAPGLKPPMADAALPLVAAGVFDRFPNIKIVFAHGDAGWACHWLEFMDINYVRHRHLDEYALRDPDALPSEYIRRHTWFTFHQDRSAVRFRRKLGTANLLWASNFPLDDASWPDDRQQAIRVTEELPAEDRRVLLAANTARLYRLPGFEQGFAAAEISAFDQLVYF